MSSFNTGGFLSPKTEAPSTTGGLLPDVQGDEVVFDISDPTSDLDTNDAALRVAFSYNSDPYSPFSSGYFSVQQGNAGRKVFYGWLQTPEGDISNPIEIPLVEGMSLIDLADMISNVPGVVANVLNGYELSDVTSLLRSGIYEGTDQWAFFFSELERGDVNPNDGSDIKAHIKYYLTSVEPNMNQSIPSQSLGGFISPTEVFVTSLLSKEVSFTDQKIEIDDEALVSYDYVQIQDEIIEVDSWIGSTAVVARRNAFDTPLRVHFQGAVARGLTKNNIFNSSFSNARKQYRCIAIRNDSDSLSAKKAEVYIKIPSRNNGSRWNISIEIPRSEYRASSASGGSTSSLVDSSLAGLMPDDHYVGAPVVFTGGQNSGQARIVTSYDGQSGTFSFDENLPFAPQNGDAYYADTAPSQRIPNGTVKPNVSPHSGPNINPPYLIDEFARADGFASGMSINVMGQRANSERTSSSLGPKEAVYVWIERELDDDNAGQENNRLALTLEFSKV